MRVIAGSARGLKLAAPEGARVRPTSDRAKEALMSALGGFFDGERVLDLCAGTGAIGIELLSRGCSEAVFVEPDPDAATVLQANLSRARMADRARVLLLTAEAALRQLSGGGRRFDIVFIDPPWAAELHNRLIAAVVSAQLVGPGSEIVVERQSEGAAPGTPPEGWQIAWERTYGRCHFSRLQAVDEP